MNRSLNGEYSLFRLRTWITILFEVVLFWESVNFDFRNTHKGYGNKEYKSEHFIKINKNGAKTQRTWNSVLWVLLENGMG